MGRAATYVGFTGGEFGCNRIGGNVAAALFESGGNATSLQLFDCVTSAVGCQSDRIEKREDTTGCTIVLQFCTAE